MMPSKKPLTELTADIVTAHVSNNPVRSGDLPDLIGKVHEALSSAQSAETGASPSGPQLPIGESVQTDHLVCLSCGRKHATLKRHLKSAHQLTPDQYRMRYGLAGDYPMTAPAYSERRRRLARESGLGFRRRW